MSTTSDTDVNFVLGCFDKLDNFSSILFITNYNYYFWFIFTDTIIDLFQSWFHKYLHISFHCNLKYLSDSVIFYIFRCDNWTFSIGSLQILDFELPNIKFNLNNLFHSKLIFCLKDFLSLIFFKSSIHGEICFGTCSVLFVITSKQGIKTLRKPHKTGNIFWRWFMLKTTFSYNEVL